MTDARGKDQTGLLATTAERIHDWIADGQIAGAALAVARDAEPIAELYFGDAAPGEEACAKTLWPLASISKLYSAAMIMALVEQGVLTLSLPVHAILPEFKGGGREDVTLRHLLTHTSGLIYESPAHVERLRAKTPYDELIDEAYLYPLLFKPGERLSYSDYGLAVATRVAERATGMDRAGLIQSLVLDPAGLSESYFRLPDDAYDRLAAVAGAPAADSDGGMYTSRYAIDLAHPAFGAITTVGDLLRFGLHFAPDGPRIHSRAAVRTMTTDQTPGPTPGGIPSFESASAAIAWGIGFMIVSSGRRGAALLSPGSYGHGGASGCALWIDPVERISVAYVSNAHAGLGRLPFTRRSVGVVNSVLAALTRD